MSVGSKEQRNLYQGTPARAWVEVELSALNGTSATLKLLADTGSPCAIIVSGAQLREFEITEGPTLHTNFGELISSWVRVRIPELGFDEKVLAYGSDAVVAAARSSSKQFCGLAGLPLLRLMEYGGDSGSFWIRRRD